MKQKVFSTARHMACGFLNMIHVNCRGDFHIVYCFLEGYVENNFDESTFFERNENSKINDFIAKLPSAR